MTPTADATLQQLVYRNEITDLVRRLGVDLDEGHFDDMRSLLVEDATVRTPGGTAEGREAVVAQARRNHRPEQLSQHVITNLLIDLDGDRAHARANLVVAFGPLAGTADLARPLELPVQYTTGQVYGFDLVRTPDGWRFFGIETTPLWTSGTPIRPPQPN
jgi:SnoaL-like domain